MDTISERWTHSFCQWTQKKSFSHMSLVSQRNSGKVLFMFSISKSYTRSRGHAWGRIQMTTSMFVLSVTSAGNKVFHYMQGRKEVYVVITLFLGIPILFSLCMVKQKASYISTDLTGIQIKIMSVTMEKLVRSSLSNSCPSHAKMSALKSTD